MRAWSLTILATLAILSGCMTQPTATVKPVATLERASLPDSMAAATREPVIEASLPDVSPDGYATLRMAIRWPQPTGYRVASLPLSVQSLRFAIVKGTDELGAQIVTRQPGAATASATVRAKAAEDVVLSIKAYAELDPDPATSEAIAIGQSAPFTLVRSKFSSVQVQLVPQFPPTVTELTSPNHGLGDTDWLYYAGPGDEIVLRGENFERGATPSVLFNTTSTELFTPTPIPATSVTRVSDTELRAKVPPKATTGNPVVVVDGIMTAAPTTLWIPEVAIDAPKQTMYDPFPADTRLVPDELGYTGTSVSKPIPGAKLAATATVSWTVNTPEAYGIYGTPPIVVPSWHETNDKGSWEVVGPYSILYTPNALPPGGEYTYTDLYAQVGSVKSNVLKLVIANVCKAFPLGCQ